MQPVESSECVADRRRRSSFGATACTNRCEELGKIERFLEVSQGDIWACIQRRRLRIILVYIKPEHRASADGAHLAPHALSLTLLTADRPGLFATIAGLN